MNAEADRLEFAPPPQPGLFRALVLALFVHALLMVALTWGINWKREAENISVEAELWSALPQQAAPRLVEAPPPPPAPVARVEPPPPVVAEPDIALEREKQRKLEASKLLAEKQKREAEKKAAEDRQRQVDAAKAKASEAQAARKLEAQRAENMRRIQGMAGATGSPTSGGTAQKSSGPSDSWAGRVRARVKPNIVFTEDVAGNPRAEVEVSTSPDGTIIGQPRLVTSSGVRSWDEAVIKALIKTEVLPRDIDGRVHSPVILGFRPKDF